MNHLKDPSSHLVHWLNVIPYPRKTSPEFIKLERKYSLESPSVMYYTREGIWKGAILIVDHEELEEMDASDIHATRLNVKQVILPESCQNCKFPVAHGTVQPYCGVKGLRTSTLIRNQLVQGESREDFLDESKGSPRTTYFQDSYPDAGEARDDFWSISGDFIYRHHVEPRAKLYSPREESFLFH